jgi:pSer/pThr/pTyr-binding forkhead associated (FHA) protein
MILESLNQIKENSNIKSIHVISLMNNDDILIGRGHDCDVRVKDISVSRYHSKIKYNMKDNTLLIRDLKSKFGTLILIRTSFEIKDSIQIQIGRTYINASPLNFEQFKNINKNKEIEEQQNNEKNKNVEQIKSFEKEEINNNNYGHFETEYKEIKSEKKVEENNNNMDIEDK